MNPLKRRLHQIIFEADTKSGKRFDIILIILILLSVIIVMIESYDIDFPQVSKWLLIAEWAVTILFTIEYCLRVWIVNKPQKYIFSFFGITDLLAILPTYIGLSFG